MRSCSAKVIIGGMFGWKNNFWRIVMRKWAIFYNKRISMICFFSNWNFYSQKHYFPLNLKLVDFPEKEQYCLQCHWWLLQVLSVTHTLHALTKIFSVKQIGIDIDKNSHIDTWIWIIINYCDTMSCGLHITWFPTIIARLVWWTTCRFLRK